MHLPLLLMAGFGALTRADSASKWLKEIVAKQANNRASYLQQVSEASATPDTSSYRYLNSNTKPYRVTSLPDFNFDIGEFYSGSVPIDSSNRTLFFAFKPSTGPKVDELTIWLNGGPGCSSLDGLLHENGPWTWQPGTYLPVENPYAWSNLTNMLWVEQPVGTGFSTGDVRAYNEEDAAAEFLLFFKHFQQIFGISKYKIYITGESYAGRYVPYFGRAMLQKKDKTYYDFSGGMIFDPTIGPFLQQFTGFAAPFAIENNEYLKLNDSALKAISAQDKACGYEAYRNKYFQFPPPGPQPNGYTPPNGLSINDCITFNTVANAATQINPCFDVYDIGVQCPLLWDVLGFPGSYPYSPPGASIYFNRQDVKKAMHAPLNVTWSICASKDVFLGEDDDSSPDSTLFALPEVINATNRFLISGGDLDMLVDTNGTLLAIQNMTWGGKQGFQSRPSTPIVIEQPDLVYGVPGPQGIMGIQHYERGLMWAETFLAGHSQPEYQPRATLRYLQWVLGRIDTL